MKKALLAVAVGVFVLAGARLVIAQTEEEPTDSPLGRIGTAIQEVLDDLVADDTLTQDQADAVIDALIEKRDEVKAEREQLREMIDEFWSDDQLTQEEIDQLPDGHPWSRLSELLDDGVITRDELSELRPLHRHRRGFGVGGSNA